MPAFELPALDSDGLVYGSRAAEAALEAERQAVLSEALERGHSEGFAAGQQQAREQLEPVVAAVREVLVGIENVRDEVSAAVEVVGIDEDCHSLTIDQAPQCATHDVDDHGRVGFQLTGEDLLGDLEREIDRRDLDRSRDLIADVLDPDEHLAYGRNDRFELLAGLLLTCCESL